MCFVLVRITMPICKAVDKILCPLLNLDTYYFPLQILLHFDLCKQLLFNETDKV